MKKRILAIITICLFIVILSITTFARNNYKGGNEVFTIAYDRNTYSTEQGVVDFHINQYVTDTPVSVLAKDGWINQLFHGSVPSQTSSTLILFNGTKLTFMFSADSYSVYYQWQTNDDWIGTPIIEDAKRYIDFFLYIDTHGNMKICTFERGTLNILSTAPNKVDWSGVIFPYGQVPGGTDAMKSSYEQGYKKGKIDGINIARPEAYNQGYIDGQATNEIVGNTIEGFFSGLTNFFGPFLSIGIGGFTLFNLLGILFTTFVVLIILKIIRGM